MGYRVAARLTMLLLLGCHPEQRGSASSASATVAAHSSKMLLDWFAFGFLWGTAYLTIRDDGLATYKYLDSHPEQSGAHATLMLSSKDLAEITTRLAECRPCKFRSSRKYGIPDETNYSIHFKLPRMACNVSAWAGEWEKSPIGNACEQTLEKLRQRILTSGSKLPPPASADGM